MISTKTRFAKAMSLTVPRVLKLVSIPFTTESLVKFSIPVLERIQAVIHIDHWICIVSGQAIGPSHPVCRLRRVGPGGWKSFLLSQELRERPWIGELAWEVGSVCHKEGCQYHGKIKG